MTIRAVVILAVPAFILLVLSAVGVLPKLQLSDAVGRQSENSPGSVNDRFLQEEIAKRGDQCTSVDAINRMESYDDIRSFEVVCDTGSKAARYEVQIKMSTGGVKITRR